MFLIRQWIDRLRSQVLFLPVMITLGLIALAWILVEVDRWIDELPGWIQGMTFTGGPEAAWEILSAIATSIVTLTGVTFSVTVVALALRSQQFGPRLLRNFTRKTLNQVVLGVFVGTITYALVILRLIRGGEAGYVPQLAVSVAVLLTLLCLALFVLFIDRIVESIQATTVIAEAAAEARASIRKRFRSPDGLASRPAPGTSGDLTVAAPGDRREEGGLAISANRTGYIEGIDVEALVGIASEADLTIEMALPVGAFTGGRTVIARLEPAAEVPDSVPRRVRRAVSIGRHRSIAQDPDFGFRQIVDVAALALSTGVNDPTTAVTCLDHLGALLAEIAVRNPIPEKHQDEEGRIRVVTREPSFRSLVELAFTDIRRYGQNDLSVALRIVEVISELATLVVREEDREVLEREVWKVARGAQRALDDPADLERINGAIRDAMAALERIWMPVQPVATPHASTERQE